MSAIGKCGDRRSRGSCEGIYTQVSQPRQPSALFHATDIDGCDDSGWSSSQAKPPMRRVCGDDLHTADLSLTTGTIDPSKLSAAAAATTNTSRQMASHRLGRFRSSNLLGCGAIVRVPRQQCPTPTSDRRFCMIITWLTPVGCRLYHLGGTSLDRVLGTGSHR